MAPGWERDFRVEFGGSGGLTGSLIGIIIPVLLNSFVALDLPPFWQQVAVGAVLIGAVRDR